MATPNFIKVMPNPFINEFIVKMENNLSSNVVIRCYDMSGKLVKQQAVSGKGMVTATIATNDLAEGTYMVEVSNKRNSIQNQTG